MINIDNFDEIKQTYTDFWNHANHKRPLMYVVAPVNPNLEKPAFGGTLKERWFSPEYQIAAARARMNNTYYKGESYPYIGPDLGPDILGAMLGCNIEFGETTSWAVHCVEDWETVPPFKLDTQNPWFKAIENLVDAFVEDARQGDYLIGIPDFHPGMDALVSLRGPQDLCYDLYDTPELVLQKNDEILPVYQQVFDIFYRKVSKYQPGTTHWMNAWHPQKYYNVSCDFMGMLSHEMFDEFVKDEIIRESKMYDACMFHLDGPDASKHLDALLAVDSINGIQWQYGAGDTTAKDWIPMMQKIQQAGKNIIVDIVYDDIEPLLKNLAPEGLMLNAYCNSPQEADAVMEKVNKTLGLTV